MSALVAAGALLCMPLAHTASDKGEAIDLRNLTNTKGDCGKGTMSTEELELVQGTTLLRASKAHATGAVDCAWGNATWNLTGDVHAEFDGAVLDTQAAIAVFANGRLESIKVQQAPAQSQQQKKSPVHLEFDGAVLDSQTATVLFTAGRMKNVQAQGSPGLPAQFSHQLKGSPRRVRGRAGKLEYDVATKQIQISVDASFADGTFDFQAQVVNYNLATSIWEVPDNLKGNTTPEERVPAPRAPDRATAK